MGRREEGAPLTDWRHPRGGVHVGHGRGDWAASRAPSTVPLGCSTLSVVPRLRLLLARERPSPDCRRRWRDHEALFGLGFPAAPSSSGTALGHDVTDVWHACTEVHTGSHDVLTVRAMLPPLLRQCAAAGLEFKETKVAHRASAQASSGLASSNLYLEFLRCAHVDVRCACRLCQTVH